MWGCPLKPSKLTQGWLWGSQVADEKKTKHTVFIITQLIKQKIKQQAGFLLLENYSHSSFTLSSKNIGKYSKNKQKTKCVCFHEIIRLMMTKVETKMKNRSHRYDINRPRFRHGRKYSKHKKCLSKMMLLCIKVACVVNLKLVLTD